jgi:hypothetical protein
MSVPHAACARWARERYLGMGETEEGLVPPVGGGRAE